jgi:3-oxoacyl-[acyl-carrier protein] reductase
MFSLEGMNALVTGASGAIGSSIALHLAIQGAGLVISGTRKDALLETASSIKQASGQDPIVLISDLSDPSAVMRLFKDSEEQTGHIDILVNNAGINKDKLFSKMTEQDLQDVLDINLKATFTLTREAISFMASRRFGRIINISSVVGFTGNIGQANYCASKAAIVAMSKAVALECARKGIVINCIAPGAISSPMINNLSSQAIERFTAKIPMSRLGNPEDVASACCFLASREAAYITGQTIHVNGGMLMQ